MITPAIEYTGDGEWTFTTQVSDCCGASCWGKLSADGRDATGPWCNECGKECDLAEKGQPHTDDETEARVAA